MTQLRSLKARDIMQADVHCFSPGTSIESAVATLDDLHITGAPVVDGSRRLVGVLSASDVTRTEHVDGDRIDVGRGDWSMAETDSDGDTRIPDKDDFSPPAMGLRSEAGARTVGDWMTVGVVSVGPGDSLREVCRTLLDNEIHRVCVVDDGELVGLITSTDLVRCLAEHL